MSRSLTALLFLLAAPCAAQSVPAGFPPGAAILQEGFKFPEGPTIAPDGTLYVADPQADRIHRWNGTKAEIFAENTRSTNGIAFAKDGTLWGCSAGAHALAKFSPAGEMTLVLESVEGKPLDSPNDLAIDANGNVFFTNPAGMGVPKPGARGDVVRMRPDGSAAVVARDAVFPNGIDFSPDGEFLYVADLFGGCVVYRYPVTGDGEIGPGEAWVKIGSGWLDGMAVAASGNVYVAVNLESKIAVFDPNGAPLRTIQFPPMSQVSNLCFGGPDMKTIYVTMGGVGRPGRLCSMPSDEPGSKLPCCR